MNCDILATLYIKSNGEILCNDDFGERVSLGSCHSNGEATSIHHTLNNERYEHIRTALQRGAVPWPNVCEDCAFFRPDEHYSNDLLKDRIIQKIQFESSLGCALKCPQCSNLIQIKTRTGARHFSPESMSDLLEDLKENEYQIRSIEYCGQGEPLNNPRFPELLATARRIFPSTLQRVITNGNHDYSKTMGTEFVEETVVAIDGAHQESYEKYRVKGDISKALKFMSDAIDFQKPKGGLVVWKYVLFETNDSDEELLEAQHLSDRLGVSRLWFVHSHTSNRSKRHTYENPHTIPIRSSRVKIDSHPSYFRHAVTIVPGKTPDRIFGDNSIVCLMYVDKIVIHTNESISISGWAASESSLSHISLSVGEHYLGDLSFVVRRPDVVAAHAVFDEVLCGFDSLVPVDQIGIEPGQLLRFDFFDHQTKLASFNLTIEGNCF